MRHKNISVMNWEISLIFISNVKNVCNYIGKENSLRIHSLSLENYLSLSKNDNLLNIIDSYLT